LKYPLIGVVVDKEVVAKICCSGKEVTPIVETEGKESEDF